MRFRLSGLLARLGGEEYGAILFRRASGVFTIRSGGLALMLLVQLFLARMLGATQYGDFAYAQAWMSVLATVGVFGLQNASMRYVAAYNAYEQWPLLCGFLRFARLTSVGLSLAVAAITVPLALILREYLQPGQLTPLLLGLAIVPIMARLLLSQGVVRGLKRPVEAELPERFARPLLIAFGVGIMALMLVQITAVTAVAALAVAVIVALVITVRVERRLLPLATRLSPPEYRTSQWFRSGAALLLMSGMQIIMSRLDILMLGAMIGSEAAGIYNVASRFAELASFGLAATNAIAAPMISELYWSGQLAQLQRVLALAALGVVAFTTVVFVVLVVFSDFFLGLFGQNFIAGGGALFILLLGQVMNAGCGCVGYLTTMTGHERWAALSQGVAAVLNVGLNVTLIPRFGLEGAATATATSMVVWNLALLIFVMRRLRLNPTILSARISA